MNKARRSAVAWTFSQCKELRIAGRGSQYIVLILGLLETRRSSDIDPQRSDGGEGTRTKATGRVASLHLNDLAFGAID
jgi:hypothetical protein